MSAILLRIAPHLAVGLAGFIGGGLTHWFLVSASEAAPKKLRTTIADQRAHIRSLQTAVVEAQLAAAEVTRQNESAHERLARIGRERDQLEESFRAYRSQTERERVEHRQVKDWVEKSLQYDAPPARSEEILAIRMQFDALRHALPAADFRRLEQSSAYQKLAEVLSPLPRAGL